jgi:hypothetical protein
MLLESNDYGVRSSILPSSRLCMCVHICVRLSDFFTPASCYL